MGRKSDRQAARGPEPERWFSKREADPTFTPDASVN